MSASTATQARTTQAHLTGVRRIYVSGPMTGKPQFNYPAFRLATERLRGLGFEVYCPTERVSENGAPIDTSAMTGTERLPKDIFDLRKAFAEYSAFITTEADAVAVLSGWRRSPGARGEVALAVAIGLPVIDAETLALVDTDPASFELEDSIERHPAGTGLLHRPGLSVVPDPTANPTADATADAGPGNAVEVADSALSSTEIRVTSASGGQKGVKEARFALIPPGPLWELAVLYGRGAEKYKPDNWKHGYAWSLSYDALKRHLDLWWSREEDYDEEMGVKHLINVAWHAFNLAWFMENRPDYDDRPNGLADADGVFAGETYKGALPTPDWILEKRAREAAEAAEAAAAAEQEAAPERSASEG